jgi:hypothetical protein
VEVRPFQKNAPFVDSHDYSTLEKLVGKVIDFKVRGGKLVETVQWAVDVEQNKLAQLGWRMTETGFLKAVSVGFYPERYVRPGDSDYEKQLKDLGLSTTDNIRAIHVQQQQLELSVCILGANPNALANARSAGVLSFDEFDFLSAPHRAARLRKNTRSNRAVDEMLEILRGASRKPQNPADEMLSALRTRL